MPTVPKICYRRKRKGRCVVDESFGSYDYLTTGMYRPAVIEAQNPITEETVYPAVGGAPSTVVGWVTSIGFIGFALFMIFGH